jgi:tetratricopeptide (TPR) repeat protein
MKRSDCIGVIKAKAGRREISFLLGLVFLFYAVSYCFGQLDFNMAERKTIEKYKRSNPLFLSGQKDFVKEKFQKAREKLEKCIGIMPEHPYAWLLLAQIESRENNLAKALEDIQKAKINFENIAQFQTLTQERLFNKLREQKDELQAQVDSLEVKTGKSKSSGSSAQPSLGQTKVNQIKTGMSALDMQTRRPISSTIDIPAEYFYVHGNIFFKMRRFDDARDQYLEVIKRDPKYGNAYNNLANLYFMTKDYQKALDYLTQAESNGATVNPKLKEAVLKGLGK